MFEGEGFLKLFGLHILVLSGGGYDDRVFVLLDGVRSPGCLYWARIGFLLSVCAWNIRANAVIGFFGLKFRFSVGSA